MGLLEDKLIELSFFPHSDLFISWPNFIEESVSTETNRGNIAIKYSEVPYLVYFLARKLGTDFLPEKIIEKTKNERRISFADMSIEEFYNRANYFLESRRKLWELLEDKNMKDQIFNRELRFLKEMFPHHEYIGFVPPSAEYSCVDILYKEDIYLAQRKNILRLDEELLKEILKRTIDHYGIVISPCLNLL